MPHSAILFCWLSNKRSSTFQIQSTDLPANNRQQSRAFIYCYMARANCMHFNTKSQNSGDIFKAPRNNGGLHSNE